MVNFGSDKPMHPKKSMAMYPRPDNVYTHKSSLNFDMMRAKIFEEREGTNTDFYVWVVHIFIGFGTALIAFLLTVIEEASAEYRNATVQTLLDQDSASSFKAYTFYVGFAMVFVLIASLLTIYVGPGANGSGVAEIMGMLNGINYPGVIGFRTLFVKVFGTFFAVAGGLCIGKEGPLAHIGANVGAISAHIPITGFRCLRNDVIKRQLVAAGASAGVSAAFGSPIGGSLFSYESSKPNTFWTFSMLWRVFFGSSICTFMLSIFTALWNGSPFSLTDAATLKFGQLESEENTLLDIPAAVFIGGVCGCLGALFIHVNVNLAMLRKKYINTNAKRLAEAAFFAFMTSTCFFMAVFLRRDNCKPTLDTEDKES